MYPEITKILAKNSSISFKNVLKSGDLPKIGRKSGEFGNSPEIGRISRKSGGFGGLDINKLTFPPVMKENLKLNNRMGREFKIYF